MKRASTKFTIADLDRLVASKNLRGYRINNQNAVIPPVATPVPLSQIPSAEPAAVTHIREVLDRFQISYETEYRFHPVRKFRFDVAIVDRKIAIEYEGIFSEKSRHTNLKGYTNDCIKYNLAQALGWRVLRYTAMNYLDVERDLIVTF